LKHTLLLISTLATLALPGLATPITIVNPSFETPSLGGSGFEAVSNGWSGTGIYYAPASSVLTAPVPDGSQVLTFGDDPSESDHESVTQTLTTAWAANTTYTLTFYVGAFKSTATLYSGYVATLSAGGTVLATDENQVTPASNSFVQDTLTFVTGGTAPGGNITIGLADPSQPGIVSFDLVQLNAVSNVQGSSAPEPGAWILVAAGLVLLGFTRAIRARANVT
jgi:hypothetical protein